MDLPPPLLIIERGVVVTYKTQAIAKAAVFKAHITGAEATAEEAKALALQMGRDDLAAKIGVLETLLRRAHRAANRLARELGDDADFGGGVTVYSGGDDKPDDEPPPPPGGP